MSLIITDEQAEKLFTIKEFMKQFIGKSKTDLYERSLKRMIKAIEEILKRGEIK